MKLTKKQAKKYITPQQQRNYEYEMAVTGIVLRTVVGSFLKVLRDEYGYGKKRLDSLKAKVDFQLECIAKDYVRAQELLDMVEKETGFNWFTEEV